MTDWTRKILIDRSENLHYKAEYSTWVDAEYLNSQFGHNQEFSMEPDLKALFSSLVAGDLLRMSLRPPLFEAETVYMVSVLRVDDNGLYLSRLSEDGPISLADGPNNPYRWSDEKEALVDKTGTVSDWYTKDILIERGGAKDAAVRYATIPRVEQLPCRLTEIEAAAEKFMTDPRHRIIADIVLGDEGDDQADQIALVLSVMGVTLTEEQFVGLVWYLTCSMVVEADPDNADNLFEP